jgi:aminopeptidase-like protein
MRVESLEATLNLGATLTIPESDSTGERMHQFIAELYPICRSITGDGVRATLRRIQREVPLVIKEIPSGTPVFDWTVPREWNIRDAYIKNSRGERVVDFQKSNLHVVSYSVPIRRRMPLAELRPHLHTLPDRPDWIPYRTSYYQDNWGFCLSERQLKRLDDEEYEVCIDSTLEDGSLTYGELLLPGETSHEMLFSCHVCHPSMCNDNLSGIAIATFLAQRLQSTPRRYSYRFLFIPGTIGAITWLAKNAETAYRIRHGLVLAGVGDRYPLVYKKSRRGNAEIDRAVAHVFRHSGREYKTTDFSPYGYDERQYCSPGFDLAVGRLSRAPHGEFLEYHTSADNLEFVAPESLTETFSVCLKIIDLLEHNRTYISMNPRCEPQLGKRGLYRAIGGKSDSGRSEMALLWVLNLSDGRHTLLDIAERAELPFAAVASATEILEKHGLLRDSPDALQAT